MTVWQELHKMTMSLVHTSEQKRGATGEDEAAGR